MIVLRAIYHYLGRFLLFWRDFLIGDDWWGAGIVLLGLGFTYLALHFGVTAFWIPMLFVTVSLAQNLLRARRRAAHAAAAQAMPAQPAGAHDPGRHPPVS
jgi:hypothetical protein